jgi:polyisoprenoid-binding protein YceI
LNHTVGVIVRFVALLLLGVVSVAPGLGQEVALDFVPAKTSVKFTLGDTIHTVHGEFALKHGGIRFDPGTGVIAGEVVVDATSGHSGNGMRDRKMHKEILESATYPEIIFRPDRVDGKVSPQGKSKIQVHGTFSIHGADHEISIPLEVEMAQDRWSSTGHFVVPYQQWGIKNPSTFILRVSESVEIDVQASGVTPAAPASPAGAGAH